MRSWIFAGGCSLLLAVLSAVPGTAAPALTDYAIFAANGGVKIGGGSLITGLVGSGFVGTQVSQKALILNASGDLNGDARVTWYTQLNNGCFISGKVYHPAGTGISMGNPAGIGGEVIGDPELPALPPATPFGSGGTSHTGLPNGTTIPLSPGSYGTVALGGTCTLVLGAGDYMFDALSMGNGAKIKVDLLGGQTHIYVTGKANFGSADVILLSGGGPNDVTLESHWVATGPDPYGFVAAAGSDWIGNVFTPYSGIHYGGGAGPTTFEGRFVAGEDVNIEHGVRNNGSQTTRSAAATWGSVRRRFR